jgi:hypothetical protein
MIPRFVVRFAPVLCHAVGCSPSANSLKNRDAKKLPARLLLVAPLLLMALRLGAQDDWPPDDPDNGPPPQQYPSAPQNAYSTPQYQSQYQQPTYAAQGNPQTYPQSGYAQQLNSVEPLTPDQLTQLVAPIALYPDALVAQILAASTYPAQLAAASQWLRSMGNAPAEQIAADADAQSTWDPSVKALTAFPQVLTWLSGNLQWATSLGNAYYNQPQDVLQTIQVMRQRAEEAGNLQSTPQQEVTENQGAIDIAPANPETVYVPTYNPWSVYGEPVDPYPGFSLLGAIGSFLGDSPVQFGLSFAMNAFMHTPWGILGWGLDWFAHSVLFDHDCYYTHSRSVADWGFPNGGPRFGRGYGPDRGWNHYGSSRYGSVRSGYAPRFGGGSQFNRGYGPGKREGYGPGYREGSNPGWQRYGDARTAEGFNRGFPQRPLAPTRGAFPPQTAYNRYPQAIGRPQPPSYAPRQFAGQPGRSNYGYGDSRAPHNAYAGRSGMNFGGPAYREPQNNYRGSTGRTYDAYRGNQFSSPQRSGGFHLFGGGHNSGNSGGRSFSFGGGGHSSWGGGGHSSWGGHSGGGSSHFGGGGGHSFGGGGHSSGGGHSGHHR